MLFANRRVWRRIGLIFWFLHVFAALAYRAAPPSLFVFRRVAFSSSFRVFSGSCVAPSLPSYFPPAPLPYLYSHFLLHCMSCSQAGFQFAASSSVGSRFSLFVVLFIVPYVYWVGGFRVAFFGCADCIYVCVRVCYRKSTECSGIAAKSPKFSD